MLNNEELISVREDFISLLHNIKREGCDIEGLVEYLETKGFFSAPATSKYFCSFEGGLMLHSINVYKTMQRLADTFATNKYSEDTLLIVGLLHNIYKANLYEMCTKNEKVYSKYGKSKDALGYYNWESSLSYRVVDETKRDIYGGNGFSSYFIISSFIPLTLEESVVLANFNELLSDESNKSSVFQILSKYPLASLLLSSSMISSYCIENPNSSSQEPQPKAQEPQEETK